MTTTTDLDARSRPGWTGKLWLDIEDTYAAILGHPFLRGLTRGDLPADAFSYFIAQDAEYVREFGKAIALLGSKAPSFELATFLTRHATKGMLAESTLHETLVADLGGDPTALAVPPSPTTLAYTSYVTSTVYKGDFADGLAVIMPCVWIYAEVGRQLCSEGSPNPVYQRWIDMYSGDDYLDECQTALTWTDRVGSTLTGRQEERARHHFRVAARYEWMFWDAAWQGENWPV
jgi:thiaminase/transcriptional activator TenA